jgi:hypothetical protein
MSFHYFNFSATGDLNNKNLKNSSSMLLFLYTGEEAEAGKGVKGNQT